jgi:hypothetical protein
VDGSARSIAQDLSPRRLALLGRPDRQDDLGACEGQSAGGLSAGAAVRSGDDEAAAAL